MPHVVKATPYHRSAGRAAGQAAYLSHGEKGVPTAERREVYGLGDDYKEVSKTIADPTERQATLQKMILADAAKVPQATFHHHIFTVDDRAAAKLAAMDRPVAEQRLRSAMNQTFNASAAGRQFQGMYAIHWDGGYARGAHPHVHVLYSPMRQDGRAIFMGPRQLESIKMGWNRSIDRTLQLGPKRTPRLPRALDQGLSGLRAVRRAHEFANNPGRAAIQTAGRAVARGVFKAVSLGRGALPTPARAATARPTSLAASVANKAITMGYRAVLGKFAVPVDAARMVVQLAFGRGRDR